MGIAIEKRPFSVNSVPNGFEGTWRWSNGGIVEVFSGGTIKAGTFEGKWQSIPGGGNYEIHWPILDTITMAEDGKSLQGVNQFGSFTAERIDSCN